MKKRVFGLLLALAMVACLLPTTAMADVMPTADRTGPYDNDTANIFYVDEYRWLINILGSGAFNC